MTCPADLSAEAPCAKVEAHCAQAEALFATTDENAKNAKSAKTGNR